LTAGFDQLTSVDQFDSPIATWHMAECFLSPD